MVNEMACPNCGYENPSFFFEGDILPEMVECSICNTEYVVEFWEKAQTE